jgi:hypothetical protein
MSKQHVTFFNKGELMAEEIKELIGIGHKIISLVSGHDGWMLITEEDDGNDS